MRRHNHRCLAAGARHVVRISRSGILTKTIDPKEPTIDRTLVRYPRRCRRTDELSVAFGQNAFAVPDTVLKIKIAEPRPVAAGTDFEPCPRKLPNGSVSIRMVRMPTLSNSAACGKDR